MEDENYIYEIVSKNIQKQRKLKGLTQELFKGVKRKELSYNSKYDYYKLINVMLNQAVKWELLSTNPNLKTHKPKKEKVERKFYDIEQAKEFLFCLKNGPIKYRVLLILALDSGARRGEISALRWNDLDFNVNTLVIDNSLKVVNGEVDEKKNKLIKPSYYFK